MHARAYDVCDNIVHVEALLAPAQCTDEGTDEPDLAICDIDHQRRHAVNGTVHGFVGISQ